MVLCVVFFDVVAVVIGFAVFIQAFLLVQILQVTVLNRIFIWCLMSLQFIDFVGPIALAYRLARRSVHDNF